jgi:hypothetical protein
VELRIDYPESRPVGEQQPGAPAPGRGESGHQADQAKEYREHQPPVRVDDDPVGLQALLLRRGRTVGGPEPVGQPDAGADDRRHENRGHEE